MEDNKFFQTVWRFNGLLISVAGLLAIILMSFAGYHMITDIFHDRSVTNIVNVADNKEIEENWTLGSMISVPGIKSIIIPLHSDQSYAQSYYSKSSYSVRNYLFINTETNQKKWLLQNNNCLLTDINILSEKDYEDPDKKACAIMYQVIKKDSDGNNRLTTQDKITLALSHPSGKNYKEILSNIDVFVGVNLIDQKNILIVYQVDNIGYSANVSLIDFVVFNKSELPIPK